MAENSEYQEYMDLLGLEGSPQRKELITKEAESIKQWPKEIAAYQEVVRAKIVQLLGNTLFPVRRVKRQQDFNASPRTKPKMVQELFTADTELQAITRDDIAEHGETAIIQNIIIDPRRITDTLLRNLGLNEFIPTGKKLSKADRMKMRVGAIPVIKEFLTHAIEPLAYGHEEVQQPEDRGYFRLFRITKGKNTGRMVGVQDNGNGEKLFLTDLHSAFRRIDHIEESYAEEMEKLHRIRQILRDITGRVQSGWSEIRDTVELEQMKAELFKIVESLKLVKNKHKVKMKENLERCLTFQDKTKRMNPGSRLAILASVNDSIGRRIDESGRILGYLAKDRVRTEDAIAEQANILADFHHRVEQHVDRLVLLHPSKKIDPTARQKIITNLTVQRTQCESFVFEPYVSLARFVIAEIDAIIAILNSDNVNDQGVREQAKKSFIMMYVVSKLLKLEMDLMKLRDEFFAPGQKLENVYVKSLVERVQAIHEAFFIKKVAPEMRVKEFGEIFGHVYALLHGIKNTAGQSLKGGAPEKQRVAALEQINGKLRDFDPYEKLRGQ